MKKKIVNGFLMMALLVSSMGTFVSCKDYDEDSYVDLRSRYTNLQSQIDALNQWKSTLKTCECDLKGYITKTYADENYAPIALTEAVKKLEDAYTKLETLENFDPNTVSTLADAVNQLNTTVTQAANDAKMALELAQSFDVDLKGLKNSISTIQNQITVWNDQLKVVMDSTSYALTLAKTDSALIVDLQKRVEALENMGYHVWTIGTDGYWYDNGNKTDNRAIAQDGKDADVWTIGNDGWWYKNGEKTDYQAVGRDGASGSSSNTWTIGPDGYWYQNGVKTNYRAVGKDGVNGKDADVWTIGADGYWYKNGVKTEYNALGSGSDWTIGADGYWYKDGVKTDYKAQGEDGKSADVWSIGADGYWYKNGEKTEYKALGSDSEWTIGSDGYWYKNGEKTEYKAQGDPGEAGPAGKDADVWSIGADGYWYKNDVKTEYVAVGKDGKDGTVSDAQIEQITKTIIDKINLSNYYTISQVDSAVNVAYKVAYSADSLANAVKDSLAYYVTLDELSDKVTELFQPGTDATKAVEKVMEEYFYTKTLIDEKIFNITTSITNIQNDLKAQITSININATYNPVLGYLNLPLDVRSNLLLGYFGVSDAKFAFPAAGGKWVNDDEHFTDDEIEVMTGGGSLNAVEGYITVEGGEYFAKDNGDGKLKIGTVFVTVNPDNVDFEGQTLTLEDSKMNQPQIELLPAGKASDLLTFGYNRTRADNHALYKADAVVDYTDEAYINSIRLKLNIDNAKARIKSVYKDKLKSKANIVNLLTDLYQSIDNQLPAYCVKAEWNDNTVGKRAVRSDFSIAASVVKPLSFNTLNLDILKKGLPGRNRIYKLIDKIIHKIKVDSPVPHTDNWIEFEKIESADGKTLTVIYKTYIDGVYKTDTATIDLTDDEASDVRNLIEVLAEANEGTAEILAELINELNKVDSNWEQVFSDAETNMVNSIMEYVDKAYSKANNYYHLYTLLDLNMVVSDPSKGFKFLNEYIGRATPVSSREVTLFPTSNTLEYLAPAYKKYVAVSNVYDAETLTALPKASAIAKAQAASGLNMGVVIDGDKTCKLKGEPGYIYEVSYAAVDYHGIKTRRSYYVKF